jgi:hypothetical protein
MPQNNFFLLPFSEHHGPNEIGNGPHIQVEATGESETRPKNIAVNFIIKY